MIYRYKSNKITNMNVESTNISESDSSQNIKQYTDFILIIKDKNEEIINNLYKKYWFNAYISILNITLNNGTDDMTIFYDFELNNLLKNLNNNKRSLSQSEDIDLKYIDETDTSCFVKIQFYENGEIKNIFLPNVFSTSNMVYINNIIKLIIPKLSPNLFVDNINDKLKELNISTDDSDNDDDDEDIEKENITRRLDEELYNNSDINSSDYLEYEDIISDKYYESNNIDLREANIEEKNNENTKFQKSKLTQYSSTVLYLVGIICTMYIIVIQQ